MHPLMKRCVIDVCSRSDLKYITRIVRNPYFIRRYVYFPYSQPGRVGRESHAVFALAQRKFGVPAFRQIGEQAKDKNRLNKTERDPGYDPHAVLFPSRRFAERDHAARWQTFLVDFPALQLPPVIPRTQRAHIL